MKKKRKEKCVDRIADELNTQTWKNTRPETRRVSFSLLLVVYGMREKEEWEGAR